MVLKVYNVDDSWSFYEFTVIVGVYFGKYIWKDSEKCVQFSHKECMKPQSIDYFIGDLKEGSDCVLVQGHHEGKALTVVFDRFSDFHTGFLMENGKTIDKF